MNISIEKALLQIYAIFWKQNGSPYQLENYHDAILVVYEIVVAQECQRAIDEGWVFNESAYLMVDFSTEEMGIITSYI